MVQFPHEKFICFCYELYWNEAEIDDVIWKADIKYDRALILKLFLRTLERGSLSQTVELKHLLRLDSVCEGELLSVITKAACYEQEGYVRLSKSKNLRSSLPEVFCKKDVLRNFAKFTGEFSLFLTKLQAWGSGTVVFLWILWNF